MSTEEANRLSAGVRFNRSVARAHVGRGGSLTILVNEAMPCLDGMPLHRMLRWLPAVGAAKVARILFDLPSQLPLRDLTSEQRTTFISRLREYESEKVHRAIYRGDTVNDEQRQALYEAARTERTREGWSEVPAHARARTSDVETSHAAAVGSKAMQIRRVLEVHAVQHGLTDDEVSIRTGLDLWRRCSDARTLGYLDWLTDGYGKPITRKARSGKAARVSCLTALGREALHGRES